VQGGETGLKAKLFASVQSNGVIWQPYVTGTVDWRFNYSHVANFPGQVALATGDAVSFADATTFVGAKLGLDVKMANGWTVGANGFYDHSSDTEIVGGTAYVKIPFAETAVSARY
jgi:outer membrane autotransporter protein